MTFDTDVLVWVLRGDSGAAALVGTAGRRALSVVSYMELLRGARDRAELSAVKQFILRQGFEILPLSENIGHRAAMYLEHYGLEVALDVADALIAATAVENALDLCTANTKHFAIIPHLRIRMFRPL